MPALLVLCSGFAPHVTGEGSDRSIDVLHVERVIDGDTYVLSNGETVRLIGVDTPETFGTYKLFRDARESNRDVSLIQKLGAVATRYAESIVLDQPIVVTYDQANAVTGHKDRFGRTLAYVNVASVDGQPLYCVNDRLIYDGFASAYVKYAFGRTDWYLEAEREARQNRRGLWADHVFEEPVVKQLMSSVDDLYVTRTGTKYHKASCSALRNSKIPFDIYADPAHDYAACKICKPNAGN